uniref:COP9 signalosome complex subunit 9 n=1 Tax=Canis lupus dingo TaxID=286419 RepID=A0A8C0KMG8_CANLU
YLFMRDTERERGRDIGRGRSRLPAGSPTWDSIHGLQDQGRRRAGGELKPAVDEMLPEGGGSTGLLKDLAADEKAVHADFFNDFEDRFDDDDLP